MREGKDWGGDPPQEIDQDETGTPEPADDLAIPPLGRWRPSKALMEIFLAGHRATPEANAIPEPVHPATDKKEGYGDGLTPPDSVDALYEPKVRRFQLAQETREAILAGFKATPETNAIPEPVHPATDEKEG